MKYITTIGVLEYEVEILDDGLVSVDGDTYQINFESVSGELAYTLLVNGKSYEAHVDASEDELQIFILGNLYTATVEDERERRLRAASGPSPVTTGEFQLKAPMPGLVVDIAVKEGQEVSKGDVLIILESMKMQNELKAPRDGKVSRIRVEPGGSVEQKQTLLTLE